MLRPGPSILKRYAKPFLLREISFVSKSIDHYSVLGIEKGAEPKEIKKAYLKLGSEIILR